MPKIIVDIDDDFYHQTLKHKRLCFEYMGTKELVDAIANGTPLPKGHGRLIDASKLKQDIFDDNSWQYSGDSPNEGYSLRQIKNADTIIEADTERTVSRHDIYTSQSIQGC